MNQSASSEPDPLADNPWRQFLADEWERQVLDDSQVFDVGLIAAYAEGNVTDPERIQAERLLANSPAALEMLVSLRGQIAECHEPTSSEPTSPNPESTRKATATAVDVAGSESLQRAGQELSKQLDPPGRAFRKIQSMVTAASVAIAVGAIVWSFVQSENSTRLRSELASLDQRFVSQAQAFAVSQQERLATTSASSLPQYIAGTSSPTLLEMVIADTGLGSRGPNENDPPEIKGEKQATLASANAAVEQWNRITDVGVPPGVLVSRAALELAAGRLADAEASRNRLALVLGENSPEVRNLKALHLLAVSETLPSPEFAETRRQAEDILQTLTTDHPEFAAGWLNLALYRMRNLGRDEKETRDAWSGYLAVEERADLKDIVRSRLEEWDRN